MFRQTNHVPQLADGSGMTPTLPSPSRRTVQQPRPPAPILSPLLAQRVSATAADMALAASGVRFGPYLAGLVIGVVPKTAIIAFAGGSIAYALDGELGIAAILAGAIFLCAATIWFVRKSTTRDVEGTET